MIGIPISLKSWDLSTTITSVLLGFYFWSFLFRVLLFLNLKMNRLIIASPEILFWNSNSSGHKLHLLDFLLRQCISLFNFLCGRYAWLESYWSISDLILFWPLIQALERYYLSSPSYYCCTLLLWATCGYFTQEHTLVDLQHLISTSDQVLKPKFLSAYVLQSDQPDHYMLLTKLCASDIL